MAAMLMKNGANGKAPGLPDSLTHSNLVRCSVQSCPFSYTLAYGVNEDRIENGQNVLELLRRQAFALVQENHPPHMTNDYVWGGPNLGWLDREQATVAGL
jgi:hypothetical protein